MNGATDMGVLIRFALDTLGERNAHHEFERLSLEIARRRFVSNLLPATGPVGNGGDQGRDGESFWTAFARSSEAPAGFASLASSEKTVLACTVQKRNVPTKIRKDLTSICRHGDSVDRVLYFTVSSVPVATRHTLQDEARAVHGVELVIVDAVALTDFLTESDLFFLAQRHLGVPSLPGTGGGPTGDLSVAVPEDTIEHRIRGRDALLATLEKQVAVEGGRVVLCGVGGSGKSTVALAVARRAQAADMRVWWVDAATPSTFSEGLREVAVQAGVEREEAREVWNREESARDVLWQALAAPSTGRWLLVVDNADDPSLVRGWLREPGPGNTVLVTSRDRRPASWWKQATVHAVDPVDAAHGAAMLCELAPLAGSDLDARSLARRLGGLPLALLLVGRYLAMTSDDPILPESSTPRSFSAYQAALDAEFSDTVSALSHDPHGPLTRTWEMSLDLLEAKGATAARPLFRLASFFAPDPLPTDVLRRSVLELASMFQGLPETALEDAVRGLLGCGLLHRRRVETEGAALDTLVVHPLIREITRVQPDAVADAPEYTTLSVVLLAEVTSALPYDDVSARPLWRLLLPHCAFVSSDLSHAAGDEYLIRGALASRVGGFAHETGMWSLAEDQYVHALHVLRQSLTPDDPRIVATRHNLAFLRHDQGRYDDAEAEFVDVLESARRTVGPDHQTTLAARHELARLRLERGDVEYAHDELSALVPQAADLLGNDHPTTMSARHELARALRVKGDLVGARDLFEELVGDKTGALSDAASSTLATRHELADLLLELGEAEKAHAAFAEVLALENRVNGPDHPSTLITRGNLSNTLIALGRLPEAETELLGALAAWDRIGQEAHPMALVAKGSLGGLLSVTDRPGEGEALLREVAADLERTLGPTHRDTVSARLNRADVLRFLGRHSDAEAALRSVLTDLHASSDAEGRSVLSVLQRLTDLYFELGRDAEAEAELQTIVNTTTRTLGADHPETLQARHKLAAVLMRRGHVAQAAEHLSSLVGLLDEALGAAHHEAVTARCNLAFAQAHLGAVPAARRQLHHIVSVYEKGGLDGDEILATAQQLLSQLE
ncbi:hypothetical protein TUSST3_02040 [Streptomyces sp. TUS-ST3]|uniref:tetratricopeptide repeat protein n=1 Tax=Streptomyces sp. TUS-ST3 TaxID=3025591 RepID=UPI00235B3D04|nr:tetratricopeptide repeat protein [Streptomyces sp. TUS-ST3]GLP63583.1 hypothetical protein TUSST3_02040 [Streptomyces sp. TUS-ST3]